MEQTDQNSGLHQNQPILTAGEPLDKARGVLLMIHGRGASARDILTLVEPLSIPGFAYLAPQAAGNVWYPNRFLAALSENEPWLSSALSLVGDTLDRIVRAGIPINRTILLGFSQGACLAIEFAARNPRRYGGVVGFSGALIGPEETARTGVGSLEGTPVFLGCSDADPYVPVERFHSTTVFFESMGGKVDARLYPNMEHTINPDEIAFMHEMMLSLIKD